MTLINLKITQDKLYFLAMKFTNLVVASIFPVVYIYFFNLEMLGKTVQEISIVVAFKLLMMFTPATLIQKLSMDDEFNFKQFYFNRFAYESVAKGFLAGLFFLFDFQFIATAIMLTIFSCFRENIAVFLNMNGRYIVYGALSNLPNVVFIILIISFSFIGDDIVLLSFLISDILFFFIALLFIKRSDNFTDNNTSRVDLKLILHHYFLFIPTAIQSTLVSFFVNYIPLQSAGVFKIIMTIGGFGNVIGVTIKEFIEPYYRKSLLKDGLRTRLITKELIYLIIGMAIMLFPVSYIYAYFLPLSTNLVLMPGYALIVSALFVHLSSNHLLFLYKEGMEISVLKIRWSMLLFYTLGIMYALYVEPINAVVIMIFVLVLSRIFQSGFLIVVSSNHQRKYYGS